jgi:hypothetical protein
MELLEDDLVSVNLEDLPSEMTTVVDGEPEISVDEVKEMSQERTAEFEEYTTQVREVSRENSGAESLQHNSPGLTKAHIAPQEPILNTLDPRGEMAEATSQAAPSPDQTVAEEHRPEAQTEGADLTEAKPEVAPLRLQAAWVTEAVAACQANKKVRFLVVGYSVQDKH